MKPPYFMNRLGADVQVDQSVLGVNGTRTGTQTYATAKFGNGLDSPTNANYVIFTNAITSPTQGKFGFWWKPKLNSASAVNHDIINNENATPEQFHILWVGGGPYMEIYFWEGGYNSRYRFTPTFSANDLMYILIVFDANESATNRIKLYIDGSQETPSAIVNDSAWSFTNLDIKLRQIYFGATDSILDNIKVEDNTGEFQLVNNNRNNERFGLNDVEILL
jgi:hypothetical protein